MPTLVVTETWVYTLNELKERGGKAYDKALAAIRQRTDDDSWYWCSNITTDLNQWFEHGPGVGYAPDMEMPFDGGKMHEWDHERRTCSFEYEVDALAYLQRNKLGGKWRALLNFLKDHYVRISGKAGTHQRIVTDIASEDLFAEIDFAWQESEMPNERYDRLTLQARELIAHIEGSIEEVERLILKLIEEEVDYRYGDEFVHEEAEALQIGFYESGKIYGYNVEFARAEVEQATPPAVVTA